MWITLFVSPALIVVVTVIIIPLFLSLYNSLFAWSGFARSQFIGAGNFVRIFSEPTVRVRFLGALRNNVTWFLVTMAIQNTTGLLFGYLLSRRIPGSEVYKRLFFVPVLLSIVAVGFLWQLYLSPRGLVNSFFRLVEFESFVQPWLGDARFATFSIIAVNMWRWVGFPSLVFMAAIDAVPIENLEAAVVEGATEWTTFWRIVFPLIVPAITIIVVLTLIGSLNVFEQVYTMAGLEGSPYYSTDTIGTLFYRTAFGSVDSSLPQIGVGSAIGVIIYVLTLGFSVISIVSLQKREAEY